MVVHTHADKVNEIRREVLDLVLSTHNTGCFNCTLMGACKLHEYCEEYGLETTQYAGENLASEPDSTSPFFVFDQSKCVLCRRCVRVCSQLQCNGAIGLSGRGFQAHITPASERKIAESECVSCGNCVSHCPTGALSPKRRESAMNVEKILTVCPYCGVGCLMHLLVKNGKVIGVEPAQGGANEGLLCVKGKFAFDFINHPERLTQPLVRENGQLRPASWDEALGIVADKIKEAKKEFGPDAIAGASIARVTNEENYLFQKFFRAAVGTNNVDHCARY
jgi:formate dehydrogenase major subunit